MQEADEASVRETVDRAEVQVPWFFVWKTFNVCGQFYITRLKPESSGVLTDLDEEGRRVVADVYEKPSAKCCPRRFAFKG